MIQGVNYPKVNPEDVKGFARAWDSNGIKVILDATTLKFAVDFANVTLASYVDDLVMKAYKVKQAKLAAQQAAPADAAAPATPAPAPEPEKKSSIILTD
jgi:hypothetical protein